MSADFPTTEAEMLADLTSRGYKPIEEVRGIRPGVRVHHGGERFARAYHEGTAVVLHVLEKDPSAWAQSYRRRDIEVIVQHDSDTARGQRMAVGLWADYHTGVAKCLGCEFKIPSSCTCAILAGGAR